jgi:hypothetical protein
VPGAKVLEVFLSVLFLTTLAWATVTVLHHLAELVEEAKRG